MPDDKARPAGPPRRGARSRGRVSGGLSLNAIFFAIVLISFVVAGFRQITITPPPGGATPMEALSAGMIEAAKGSVTLALGLVGVMALFLAINTSSVTLLPTGVIALRASAGSADPAGILPTTLFATVCSTTIAILAAKFYSRFWPMTPAAGVIGQKRL